MRRSLVTLPAASSGTLKSTRTSARLPRRSGRSFKVFLAMNSSPFQRDCGCTHLATRAVASGLGDHETQQIDAPVRVAPLVVVPAYQLEESAIQLDPGTRVKDAGCLVVNEIAGDDLIG